MVDPARHPHDAPALRGAALPPEVLATFYRGAAGKFSPA
jgi:hypothetical protein